MSAFARTRLLTLAAVLGLAAPAAADDAKPAARPVMMVWSEPMKSGDNPLPGELSVNGTRVDTFQSKTQRDIDGLLRPGWNTLTVTTAPRPGSARDNHLTFQFGPVVRDPKGDGLRMHPLWRFPNGADWTRSEDGRYRHRSGPGVASVTLTFAVYHTGPDLEAAPPRAGDYILKGHPDKSSRLPAVTSTVFVNGTPLPTFLGEGRQVVVTPLLRPGANTIKLVTRPVGGSLEENDMKFEVGGPLEWSVPKNQYVYKRVVGFGSMDGWARDARTGQLVNRAKPGADALERTVEFTVEQLPRPAGP
jgi:hypothetical protein